MLASWLAFGLCVFALADAHRSNLSRLVALPAYLKGVPDEVVEVNVGGEVFTALRSTLRSGGGLLECIFSDRWDRNWGKDDDGRVFLDFDPESFRALLSYLRSRRHAPPFKVVTVPKMATEQAQAFKTMLDYCAMEEVEVASPATTRTAAPEEDPSALTMRVVPTYGSSLTVCGDVVKCTSSKYKGMAVGSAPLLQHGHSRTWSVSLGSQPPGYPNPQAVRVGVTSEEGNVWSTFGTHATTFAWGNMEVVMEGYTRPCRTPFTNFGGWVGWKPLDVAVFKLENEEHWPKLKVYMRRTQKVYKFQLMINQENLRKAKLFLELQGTDSQARIASASSDELAEASYWGL